METTEPSPSLRVDPKTSQRAFNRQERPPAKRRGALHQHDYRIIFASGIDLEITNCRSPGLARLLAVDYQRSKGRKGTDDRKIVRTEQLDKPDRYRGRLEPFSTDRRGKAVAVMLSGEDS